MFGAKHVLVMHKDSKRKPTHVKRTRAAAQARIQLVLSMLKQNPSEWDAICARYSDEPGADKRFGNLGRFRKGSMVPEFQKGVEHTRVGSLSGIIETDFGFHVLLRTK